MSPARFATRSRCCRRASHRARVRRERLHQCGAEAGQGHRRCDGQAGSRSAGLHPRRRLRRRRWRRTDANGLGRRPGCGLPQRAARSRRQHARDCRRGEARRRRAAASGRHAGQAGVRRVDVREDVVLGPRARGGPGARADLARHPGLPAELSRNADRRRGNPAVVRGDAHRALRVGPDAELVHARRAHARDGPARRRRRRGARVDPPPPAPGHEPLSRRAGGPTPSRCPCSPRR